MADRKKPFEIETLANLYTLTSQLGEGGAGWVYGGVDADGQPVAVKLLKEAGRDKRKRFVNESQFLKRNSHANLVPVLEDGVSPAGRFYVMPRYAGSLRASIGKLAPEAALRVFAGILDGVEAAHLLKVVHRDLKPENILLDESGVPAIADFGIASFSEEHLMTLVETKPTTRLANFQYAAPEQRNVGMRAGPPADIYALGLILNELFTGSVPHGTGYSTIGGVDANFAYLDPIVARMLSQNPAERQTSILVVKTDIQKYQAEAVSLQKISRIDQTVIPEGEVDDPLAHAPPRIVDAKWNNKTLVLTFDQVISKGWIEGLRNMGSFRAVFGLGPDRWTFQDNRVSCHVGDDSVQDAIDHFKEWMPQATMQYRYAAIRELGQLRHERLAALQRQKRDEETRMAVNSGLRF